MQGRNQSHEVAHIGGSDWRGRERGRREREREGGKEEGERGRGREGGKEGGDRRERMKGRMKGRRGRSE